MVSVSKTNFIINAWVVEAKIDSTDGLANFQPSTAHIANTIVGILIEGHIAHNLIISDKGRKIVIIPRNCSKSEWKISTGWIDLCGLIRVKDASIDKNTIEEFIKEQVRLTDDDFDKLSKTIAEKFSSIYYITETA